MSRALFEKDIMIPKRADVVIPQDALIRNLLPFVYSLGRNNEVFTAKNFFSWYAVGVLHSCLVFFLPLYAVQEGIIDGDGHNSDFWIFSITSFTCVIFLVNLKLVICTRVWNKMHVICITVSSIGLYLLFIVIYDLVSPTASRGSILQIFSSPYFYTILIAVLIISFAFDGGIYMLRRIAKPTNSEVLMDYSVEYNARKNMKRHQYKLHENDFIINN